MLDMKVKLLNRNSILPKFGSACAAGMDLYANNVIVPDEDESAYLNSLAYITIPPHKTVKIGTGIAIEPPAGYCALIFARSGLSTKYGLRPSNCVGLVDEDYRGEVVVALHNDSDETQSVEFGDRIAQLVLMPYEQVVLDVVDKLSETGRGAGGFGSTGK